MSPRSLATTNARNKYSRMQVVKPAVPITVQNQRHVSDFIAIGVEASRSAHRKCRPSRG
jgi:hypothetical protein